MSDIFADKNEHLQNEIEDLKVEVESLNEKVNDIRDMLLVLIDQLEQSARGLERLTKR